MPVELKDIAFPVAGRILVVDDTPSNLRLLMSLLKQHSYIVHPATNAQAALRFLEVTLPDLILLDVVMPGMDGYQLAERLKADERTREIPIVFISAASQPLDKVKAFGCGAVDYIVKPFQAEEVIARISTHLALHKLQRKLEQQVEERTAELKEANARLNAELAERKQLEAERQARLAAEMASRAKSVFLASMSHELRTPLNAILGYAQILKRCGNLDEGQVNALDTIRQSGEHLLTLINDILDLSRIEAGKIELFPDAVELSAFLRVVADIARVKAEIKGLEFIFEAVPDLPHAVMVDQQRLRQVLLNLLDNAVKFTDHGQVALHVEALPARSEREALLHFEVRDTGLGVPSAQHEIIFQPFEQVGEVRRRFGGTGLGLAISRQLVRLMGGDIQVDSTPGEGSRFWFDLPLPLAETAGVGPASHPQAIAGYRGRRRKIMVVDDVEANRAMQVELLASFGFDVAAAGNGQECLASLQSVAPELIVMDALMPVMNGLEATQRLRRMPGRERLPIIVVSASASPEDRIRCLEAGASAFIVKPIDEKRLLQEIGAQLGLDWEYEPLEAQPAPTDDKGEQWLAPPPSELEILHHIALTGNMRDISRQADQLAELDERYRPFASRLKELARGYQSKAILALVEKYLEQPGAGGNS